MRSRVVLAIASIVLPLILVGRIGPAGADQRVEFLEEEPLAVTSGTSEPLTVLVAVEGATKSTTVELMIAGEIESSLTVDPIDPAPVKNGLVSFEVTPDADAIASAGTLVALTNDGALARRDVLIASPAAGGVNPPSTLTLIGWRWNWIPGTGHVTIEEQAASDLGLPPDAKATTVASADGRVGTVRIQDGNLSASGIDHAGEYTGTLKTGAGDDASATTLSVRVRDMPLWPLVVLILGLLLVLVLWKWQNIGAPGWALVLRLRTLRHRGSERRTHSLREIERHLPMAQVTALPRITNPRRAGTQRLLLDALIETGYSEWLSAVTQEERDQWKLSGERYKLVVDDVKSYESSLGSLMRAAENLSASGKICAGLAKDIQIDRSPILARLRSVANGRDIVEPSDLSALSDEATSVRSDSAALRQLLERLHLLKSSAGDAVLPLAREAVVVDGSGLGDLAKRANDLAKPKQSIVAAEHERLLKAREAAFRLDFDTGEMYWKERIASPPSSIEPLQSIPEIRREYERREVTIRWIGFGITIVAGMTLLYLPKATFGSLADYVTMFLWGTVFGTGAQIATKYITPSGIGS